MDMLKVKNKKVIREIAGTTYRANKKKNMLTAFAIILTTFFNFYCYGYWGKLLEYDFRAPDPYGRNGL